MSEFIVKLADNAYISWSDTSDSPASCVFDRKDAVQLWTEERVARADATGTSLRPERTNCPTAADIISGNKAGPEDAELTLDQILARYANPEAWQAFDARAIVIEQAVGPPDDRWIKRTVELPKA